jgi:hypothetical protein
MKRSKNRVLKVWNIVVFILIIFFLGYLGYHFFGKQLGLNHIFSNNKDVKEVNKEEDNKDKEEEEPKPEKKLKIIDLDSKTRPIGIMVDNEKGAWPQAGLQDAYLIYEIIVEGGESRFFALFKDADTKMIGPDRSARHYFIDYALENDAIFTHFGFSPQAQSDIKTLGINDISGTEKDGSAFWREKVITTSWQNCFTSIARLTARAETRGYRMTYNATPVLNYSVDELDLSKATGVVAANTVKVTYSSAHYVTYVYDAENKVYKRYQRGKAQVDRVTGLQYTAKNIIVYSVENYSLNDGSGKGRQGIDNIGSGTGYYISDGYAIPITWQKSSRGSKTVYKDGNGNKLTVNDGNTFINLQPKGKTLTIE